MDVAGAVGLVKERVAQWLTRLRLHPAQSPAVRAESARSVFDDFLSKAQPHESIGAPIPPFLYQSSIVADIAIIVIAFCGFSLSSSDVSASGFFILGGNLAVALIGLLHTLAGPLLALACTGLGLKIYSRHRRAPEHVHVLCAAEAYVAVGTAVIPAVLVVLAIIDLLIWLLITVVVIAICLMLFAAVLGALSRS